jgi:pSer/pThr/pTyr-binding forkhead associated (FHA) protein
MSHPATTPAGLDVRTAAHSAADRSALPAPTAAEARAAGLDGIRGPALTWRQDGTVHVRPIAEQLRVGRSLTADVRIEDPWTSRRHALIRRTGDKLAVCDDGSLNGVFINGERVRVQADLRDGDVVTVGVTELRVVDLPAAPGARG